jgi:hypothetical protein
MNYEDVKESWNRQAGKFSQWDSLDEDQKIEWAIKASINEVLTDAVFAVSNMPKKRFPDDGLHYVWYRELVSILHSMGIK